ncbi:MAG: prepilin-type N-terminal cleavage/methylation domain-containing protein [Candidatus Hydrogenedens sp.]|nr:prepilin-type N-terminal cleavage/methylation domain-containing protein [Candidatus Hydrogenedens sp.]
MEKSKGFTLIEMMIVVAIIAIIAAIAIPNLLRSRIQTNESSAIGNLRTVAGAEASYHCTASRYAGDFDLLTDDTVGPPYLPGQWGVDAKSGYEFTLTGGGANYGCNADPELPNQSGVRQFYIDGSGVIRAEVGGAADETSAPIS